MTDSFASQLRMLLYSVPLGAFFALMYDVFRVLRAFHGEKYSSFARRTVPNVRLPLISAKAVIGKEKSRASQKLMDIYVAAGDVVYFSLAAPVYAVFLYATNDGRFRLISLLGLACGFAAWYFTFGKLVIAFSEIIIFAFRTFFSYLFFFAAWPFKRLFALSAKLLRRIADALKKSSAARKRRAAGKKAEREFIRFASEGFLAAPRSGA